MSGQTALYHQPDAVEGVLLSVYCTLSYKLRKYQQSVELHSLFLINCQDKLASSMPPEKPIEINWGRCMADCNHNTTCTCKSLNSCS